MAYDDDPWSRPPTPPQNPWATGSGSTPYGQPSAGGPARYCPSCRQALGPFGSVCSYCGADSAPTVTGQRSRIAAGLFGILLPFGVHSFYLGDTKKGVIQLVLAVLTCGIAGLWCLIEGIIILAGSINVDADGRPLAK